IAFDMLREKAGPIKEHLFLDCGQMFYYENQSVPAGASGAACAAIAGLGYFSKHLQTKKINTILLVATGTLTSPLAIQLKMKIAAIAHAITICRKDANEQ